MGVLARNCIVCVSCFHKLTYLSVKVNFGEHAVPEWGGWTESYIDGDSALS